MLYNSERDLQVELTKLDFNFFKAHPVSFYRREMSVGGCIPDLVSVYFKQDPTSQNWPHKWSYKHSFIIWLIKKRKNPTLQEIASYSYELPEKLLPILNELLANGLIKKLDDGSFQVSKQIRKLNAEVVAVEAKLRKWRDALSQAIRYKAFANIVFVAMDAIAIPRSLDVIQEFKVQQVGLCAISRGSIEWIVNPISRQHGIGHEKEYLVMSATIPATQRFWARRNNRKASSQA